MDSLSSGLAFTTTLPVMPILIDVHSTSRKRPLSSAAAAAPTLARPAPPFHPLVGNWVATGRPCDSPSPSVTHLPFTVPPPHYSSTASPAADTWSLWYEEYASRGSSAPFVAELEAFAAYSRRARARGELSPDRVRLLVEVGFEWSGALAAWRRRLVELEAWKAKTGSFVVTRERAALGQWVRMQRHLWMKGRLEEGRVAEMEAIGFVFGEARDAAWEERFCNLKKFVEEEGHARADGKLGEWVRRQQRDERKGLLEKERKERLAELGVDWGGREGAWEEKFLELSAFKVEEGHCEVPQRTSELGRWVHRQRVLFGNGKMLDERVEKLESIGFVWKQQDAAWERGIRDLELVYKSAPKTRGRLSVSKRLRQWIRNQESLDKKGLLKPERKERLRKAGHVFSGDEAESTAGIEDSADV